MKVLLVFLISISAAIAQEGEPKEKIPLTEAQVAAFEQLAGLTFDDGERTMMLEDLWDQVKNYRKLREHSLANHVSPALDFSVLPQGMSVPPQKGRSQWHDPGTPERPENLEDLAYAPLADLGYLLRTGKVTSTELTKMFLARLERLGPKLQCVVSLLPERALAAAAKADAEIKAGNYRGPLHGIPYGAKDLFAVKGTKTTWGAMPYKDQVIDDTATVIHKLDEAGAVLVAKLTLGALAWGDVWFGGKTLSPWNLKRGSSGSSAGSASATAAGLVPFSLGTETLGSIVSPSTACGATGLRPTYGRVSRAGAMALSWSMDKIGPICRSAEDAALVFEAIQGKDPRDRTSLDGPFTYHTKVDISKLRIGYLARAFTGERPGKALDDASLEVLKKLGAKLIPIEMPDYPVRDMTIILSAEGAAAFDELTRSNQDDTMVRQIRQAWPNAFRAARSIPAVEYIQANRLRSLLIEETHRVMKDIDVLVTPSFGGNQLFTTNLTGHPCVVVPNGFVEGDDGIRPHSISFLGNLFDEGVILSVANAYQKATDFHSRKPPLFK